MNESEELQVCQSIRDFLIQSSRRLAYGQEPWVIFSSSREDLDGTGQRPYPEEKCAAETDAFIRDFVRLRQWPKISKNIIRFYAGQRLDWAVNFLRVLSASSHGERVFPKPSLTGLEFVEWLLITAYNSQFRSNREYLFAPQPTAGKEQFTRSWV
jgi:hypothetical protein